MILRCDSDHIIFSSKLLTQNKYQSPLIRHLHGHIAYDQPLNLLTILQNHQALSQLKERSLLQPLPSILFPQIS